MNNWVSDWLNSQREKLFHMEPKKNSKYWIVMARKVVVIKTTSYLKNNWNNLYDSWTNYRQDVYGQFYI